MNRSELIAGRPGSMLGWILGSSLFLVLGCSPEDKVTEDKATTKNTTQKTNPEKKSEEKSEEKRPAAIPFQDILALWAQRFAQRPPASFDSPMPELDEKTKLQVADHIFTALATGRKMQRYAKQAREALWEKPAQGIAGLALYLADKENGGSSRARALALFADKPHPLLTSLCLQHLDDRERLVRLECVRRLDEAHSLGNIPRLLRRTREFYEEDPEILAAIFATLARLGNLSGLETLLSWLDRQDLRDRGGASLIDILKLYGPPYVESDGWAGLARKAGRLLAIWKQKGEVPFLDKPKAWSDEDHYLLDREFWLFLRHLSGQPLRIVDEARFIGENAGKTMVPLLREALRDKRLRQRYHALEVLIALGLPGKPAEKEVRALLDQPLTRSYALSAYGSIHGEGALEILLGYLPTDPSLAAPPKDDMIAALTGLSHLESPIACDLLRRLFVSEKDIELKAWIANAWIASSRGAQREARDYLETLLHKKSFHEPTLLEMLRDARK